MKKIFWALGFSFLLYASPAFADTVKVPHVNNVSAPQATTTVETLHGLDLKSIDNVILVIQKESAYKLAVPKLCNGAISEIREYLKSKRLYKQQIPFIDSKLSADEAIVEFNKKYKNIETNYPTVNKELLSYAAVKGALKQIGDPYALFMNPKEYKAFMEQMKGGNFGGIGVYLNLDEKNKMIHIVDVMEDSPAYNAGIKKGDDIIKIDSVPISQMESVSKANEKLRGTPGTKVTVTVKRAKLDPFDVTITRDVIKAKSVSYKIINDNIGYMKISIFGESTGDEMRKAVDALERKGAKGYIIDVRGNGGGYVTSAIHTVSLFVPTHSNVVTLVKEGSKDLPYTSIPNIRPFDTPPMAVLIDKNSASASEITSGALQDYKTASLVGVKSYGKASVQKIYPLQNGTAMKFTTSHYVTPKKRLIDKIGIEPDVVSKLETNKPITNEKDDTQLKDAIKNVSEKIEKLEKGTGTSSSPIKLSSFSASLDSLAEMFPEGFDIKSSEMILKDGQLIDHFVVETKTGTREVYFDRGIYLEK